MTSKYDLIVIGGGHNGLTTAALTAQRGRRVLLLEARDILGGVAASEEFYPGYRTNGLLFDTSRVSRSLIAPLRLERFGLTLQKTRAAVLALEQPGRQGVMISHDPSEMSGEIEGKDLERYRDYRAFFSRIGKLVTGIFSETPPNIMAPSFRELVSLAQKGLSLKLLGKKDMLEMLRIGPMCVADWLNEWFMNDTLKAGLAAPALFGSYTGPWSPGTNANLLMHEVLSTTNVQGGPRSLVSALEECARNAGVEIRTSTHVNRIVVMGGSVRGVVLENGEELLCNAVASSADPKRTFFTMLEPQAISHKIEERVRNIRMRGTSAVLHLALNSAPHFACRNDRLVSWARTAGDFDELERAFDAVKYGEFSRKPMLEISIPSIESPDLAPAGHAVMSVLVHFAPYHLRAGWSEESRLRLEDAVLGRLEEFVPGVVSSIVGRALYTPLDLEGRYGLTEGHIFHGEHALDQMLARPMPECAQYTTPVSGLYLCGAGSHPGGGITCAPGALAAQKILAAP